MTATRTSRPSRPRATRPTTAAERKLRRKLRALWYADNVQKPTVTELEEAHHHDEPEHELAGALDGHAVDGHQFDGMHPVDDEPLRDKH